MDTHHVAHSFQKHYDSDNYPPFSRIFVACDKSISKLILEESFKKFGDIEYCKLIKEKESGNSKGLCFIKYKKTSSAALAIEEMDNKILNNTNQPLKVEIALPKGNKNSKIYTNEPEDTPPRSRLFVVCPKDMTESVLHDRFKNMKDVVYTKVISDKITGLSKGFAFIKFKKASSAALAMENVTEDGHINGVKVKVLIADPKTKTTDNVDLQQFPVLPFGLYERVMYPQYEQIPYNVYNYPSEPYYPYPNIPIPVRVTCHPSVTSNELSDLFSKCNGIESCIMETDRLTGKSNGTGHVIFTDFQSASIAVALFNGYEYPKGYTIECSLDGNNYQPYQSPMYIPNYPPLIYPQLGNNSIYPPVNIVNKIIYNSEPKLSEDTISNIFASYGPFYLEKNIENNKEQQIAIFANPVAAWFVVRDLDQRIIEGAKMELRLQR